MKRTKGRTLSLILALLLTASVFVECIDCSEARAEVSADISEDEKIEDSLVQPVEKAQTGEQNLTDLTSLYEGWNSTRVLTMYLTVSTGNEADSSNHTWSEINQYSTYYYDEQGIDRYKVEGILQIDDGNGVTEDSFGYGETVQNVSVQVRGQTSSLLSQKNYKIRIKKGKGSYDGQRTINLNKHLSMPYRFENNLAYTLMENIPQLVGGRTVFVHLMVKDTTEGGNSEFEDYGLYTMVEQVNRTYLKSHGLDDQGELYKVSFFEWYPYEAVMAVGEDYDEDAFEEYMEIKGKNDHSALRNAVEALRDDTVPIEDIVNRYFDAENICYWMAFNILVGNYDAGARNLFIYSPGNSEKLYILPWDMDDSFRLTYNRENDYVEGVSWQRGLTQFTGLVLCRRMMKEEVYRNMLTAAVEDIYSTCLTRENLTDLIGKMSAVTEEYIFREPDYRNRKVDTPEKFESLVKQLPDEIEENYRYYYENLKMPWPFFVGTPKITDGKLVFIWDVSYNPLGEGVTYSWKLADDCAFKNVIAEGAGLESPTVSVDVPSAGTWYFKVYSVNRQGYEMDCFDYIAGETGGKVYGCYEFTIYEDGTVRRGAAAE